MTSHPQRCNALFFIGRDTACADQVKGTLRYTLNFRHEESNDSACKVIMLPATEAHKAWSHFQLHRSGGGVRCRLSTMETFTFRAGRQAHWNHKWIDDSVYEFILHQARARMQRKMLPGYDVESSFFRGVIDEVGLEATLLAVKNGPYMLNGRYLNLSCHNYGEQTLEMLEARMRVINSGASLAGRDLFLLLRKEEPDFPYLWENTPVRVITRGRPSQTFEWSGLVHEDASVADVLAKAKIVVPHDMRILGIEQESPYAFLGANMQSHVKADQAVVLSDCDGYF